MAEEVKLPALGESIAAGDVVKEGQALIEVEAEKSTVEVPSPFAGRIAQILIKKGDKVKAGQTLMTIDGGNGKAAPPPAAAAPGSAAAPPAAQAGPAPEEK